MEQAVLDAVFNVLQENEEALSQGANPLAILCNPKNSHGRGCLSPKVAAAALQTLGKQNKLNLFWGDANGEQKIVAASIARGLRRHKTQVIKPGWAVVLIDVENIRIARNIPRNSENFPGLAIQEDLEEMGFLIKEAFAFTNTKAAPSELQAQCKILEGQGLIPVLCEEVKQGSSDAVDRMIHDEAVCVWGTNPEIKTIVIASADADFELTVRRLRKMGKGYLIYHVSTNINEEYRRKTGGISIRLSNEAEQRAYKQIQQVLINASNMDPVGLVRWMNAFDDEQELAWGYYKQVLQAIKRLAFLPQSDRRFKQDRSFKQWVDDVRVILLSEWKEQFSYEFLHRVVSLVNNHTDLLQRKERVTYQFNRTSEHFKLISQL